MEAVDWDHRVQFYDTDGFLADAVASFLSDGLRVGEPLVVLSTRPHRDDFIARFAAQDLSWDDARRDRRLTWVDAHEALDSIMVGGVPDAGRFEEQVAPIIRAGLGRGTGQSTGSHRRVRAYGELVDLLWRDGNADAALLVEDMWNDLARTESFSLLCAYSRGNVYREARGQWHRKVCDRHTHVLPPETAEPLDEPLDEPKVEAN